MLNYQRMVPSQYEIQSSLLKAQHFSWSNHLKSIDKSSWNPSTNPIYPMFFLRVLHPPTKSPHPHRIHGAAIYGDIYHQYTPFMLAYIPAPWILWEHGFIDQASIRRSCRKWSPFAERPTRSSMRFRSSSRSTMGPSDLVWTCSLQTPGSPTLKQHIQTIWYTYHQRINENTGYTQWSWL